MEPLTEDKEAQREFFKNLISGTIDDFQKDIEIESRGIQTLFEIHDQVTRQTLQKYKNALTHLDKARKILSLPDHFETQDPVYELIRRQQRERKREMGMDENEDIFNTKSFRKGSVSAIIEAEEKVKKMLEEEKKRMYGVWRTGPDGKEYFDDTRERNRRTNYKKLCAASRLRELIEQRNTQDEQRKTSPRFGNEPWKSYRAAMAMCWLGYGKRPIRAGSADSAIKDYRISADRGDFYRSPVLRRTSHT